MTSVLKLKGSFLQFSLYIYSCLKLAYSSNTHINMTFEDTIQGHNMASSPRTDAPPAYEKLNQATSSQVLDRIQGATIKERDVTAGNSAESDRLLAP